jgi:LPXTG-site transpeptidase (sortase) family protein
MIQNRLFRHILFAIAVVGVFYVTPLISEAHMDLVEPTDSSGVELTIPYNLNEEPLRISIPNVGINIKVEASEIENGTWKVPEHAAGYAEGSAYLDEEHGNSILFAHARNGLFRDLLGIKIGDEISVIGTKNLYRYEVTSIEKILPDEIDKIKSFGDHQLTLFTCEGWNDQYRLLVKAKRVDTYSLSNSEII